MRDLYVKNAQVLVYVYSVEDKESLNEIEDLINLTERVKDKPVREVACMIVGNKSDADENSRQVSTSEGQALADKWGIQFMETSAKGNVDNLFFSLIRQYKAQVMDQQV